MEEIAERARVTTGAVYHHFRGKRDLFRAVYEQVDRELAEEIAAEAGAHPEPFEQLTAGLSAFLEACRKGAVRRIVLVDAPSVLGWEQWRQIDSRYGLRLLIRGLRAGMESGVLEQRPVEPLAHLLYGAVNEAGLMLAARRRVRRGAPEGEGPRR